MTIEGKGPELLKAVSLKPSIKSCISLPTFSAVAGQGMVVVYIVNTGSTFCTLFFSSVVDIGYV